MNDKGFPNFHRNSLFMFHEQGSSCKSQHAVVLLRGIERTLGAECKHTRQSIEAQRGNEPPTFLTCLLN